MMEDGYTKHGLTATDGYADGSSTMPGAGRWHTLTRN